MSYQPPFTITSSIASLIADISQRIGHLSALESAARTLNLRRINRIRTIQGSLAIEGNTLSQEQITAILEGKRVIAPPREIQEVRNAIKAYDLFEQWQPGAKKDLLAAHQMLMSGLLDELGQFRSGGVGVMAGQNVVHLPPPANRVPELMHDLLRWLETTTEHPLIASSVFHYEFEFIHPFADGNGRMGRLWQTLILMRQFPVLAYLPFESLIAANQKDYYRALSISDKQGTSTFFIAFMLRILREALDELLSERTGSLHAIDRIRIFLETGVKEFTRKDYMRYFKMISPATASRDLLLAVNEKKVKRFGDKNKAVYRVI